MKLAKGKTTAAKIYYLYHRLNRQKTRADKERGTVMNLRWLHWAHEIDLTLQHLESLGVETEKLHE